MFLLSGPSIPETQVSSVLILKFVYKSVPTGVEICLRFCASEGFWVSLWVLD